MLTRLKVTTIRERIRLRTGLVATHARNHPNYVDPNLNITDLAGAGVITNPCLLQLVMRVQW